MIGIYFSGTGNTKYCLEKFVSLYDRNIEITPLEDEGTIEKVAHHKDIIFAYPIYYSNLPKIVQDFICGNSDVWKEKHIFIIATMGLFMLKGYELGAEDYVTKPFPMSVFQKKLSVVLGRLAKQSGGDCYEDGALSINFSEMTASLSGKPLVFTPLEYRLLKIMTKNPQNVLTRQVLLEKLWDADGNFVDEHALTAAISRVRNKIETEGRQYIKTVYGMGYMWIGGAPK